MEEIVKDRKGNILKVGDRVKVIKLSKKEFDKISVNRFALYDIVMNNHEDCFNRIFTIENFSNIGQKDYLFVSLANVSAHYVYPEEVEKVGLLKNKIAKIRKLIN